jgi:hypothetical protein
MPRPCLSLAMPCRWGFRLCLSHLIYTVRPCLIHTCHAAPMLPCHATTMPYWKRLLKATAQRGIGMAWHVWISICRPETAYGRPARVRLLHATTRISTKVIRSISIRYTVGLAVRIFPATTRTFTKDTTLSENGRDAAWHVWVSLKSSVGYVCVLVCMCVRVYVYLCLRIGLCVCVCVCVCVCLSMVEQRRRSDNIIIFVIVPLSTYFYKNVILKCIRTFTVWSIVGYDSYSSQGLYSLEFRFNNIAVVLK